MSERWWTTRELRRAQRQGAVIRAWGRDEVRWDPRMPRDPHPWENVGDVRFSARECHPENPDGSPWTGPQNNDQGREELNMRRNAKLMKPTEFEHTEDVDRTHADGQPLTVRLAAENGGKVGGHYRRWLYRVENRSGAVLSHGDMNTRAPKTHTQAVAVLVDQMDDLFSNR